MSTVVSAPGKVLITGGYLILEQMNSGLVLSTSARFFAIVKPLRATLEPDSWAWSWADVKVSSPQLFKETMYKLSLRNCTLKQVSPPPSEGGNPFVENAIQLAIAAAKAGSVDDGAAQELLKMLLLQGLDIIILGDNAFYSFRKQIERNALPVTAETLASLPEFSAITLNPPEPSSQESSGLCLPEVAKTGLGSSAAMTTAVVAGVLEYLGCVKLPLHGSVQVDRQECEENLDLVHTVAQAAHSAAQGKVGSGFDISAAVYGSQCYVRFSPSILSMQHHHFLNPIAAVTSTSLSFSMQERPTGKNVAATIHGSSPLKKVEQLLLQKWDGQRTEYSLPPHLFLIIGEPGYGGSHTPSMVGAVLAWRKNDPEQQKVWSALAKANKDVEAGLLCLNHLAQKHRDAYLAVADLCSILPAVEWEKAAEAYPGGAEIVIALSETRNAFGRVRSGLQLLGQKAGVPIEPPIQTELLDQTMAINGVLLAGVPGAGGYDAVFAITLGQSARDRVEQEWSRKGVLSLPTKEDPCGVSLEVDDPRTSPIRNGLHAMAIV